MKKSLKITFCGIVTALICVVMTASLLPDATLAVPAVAGLLLIPVVAQAGTAYAVVCFAASSIISFFIGDKSSWLLFLVFFGHYPVIKPFMEKIKNPVAKWALKLFLFNAAATGCYFIQLYVIGVRFTAWQLAGIFALGNIAFVLYDIAVSKMAALYYLRLHKKISDILKK